MTNKLAAINPNELMAYIDALYSDHYEQAYDQTVHDIFNAVRRRIRRCQALDVIEVKYGHWDWYSSTMMECSVCKRHTARHRFEYCPHCGAKMTGGNTVNV